MSSRWNELLGQVPEVFNSLLESEPLQKPRAVQYKGLKGIYAFSEDGDIVHIGRTRNLAGRMRSHVTANENSASFAFKRARRITGKLPTYKPEGSRKDLLGDGEFRSEFLRQIEAVRNMAVRFVKVESPELQYLVELYAHLELDLPTDEFDTS